MAVLIHPTTPTRTGITPANGRAFTLAEMYALCECSCIETRPGPGGTIAVMDEEARIRRDRPALNLGATEMLISLGSISPSAFILGPVLLCTPREFGEEEEEEEDVPFDGDEREDDWNDADEDAKDWARDEA
jgi:hypothetical protein